MKLSKALQGPRGVARLAAILYFRKRGLDPGDKPLIGGVLMVSVQQDEPHASAVEMAKEAIAGVRKANKRPNLNSMVSDDEIADMMIATLALRGMDKDEP